MKCSVKYCDNEAAKGYKQCQRCRDRNQAYKDKAKARDVAAGLCTLCHKKPVEVGYKTCSSCIAKNSPPALERYYEITKAGGTMPCSHGPDRTKCPICLEKKSECSSALYHEKKSNGECIVSGCKVPAVTGKSRCRPHLNEELEYQAQRNYKQKVMVFTHYGMQCTWPGCTMVPDIDTLELDHVTGGGNKHRRHEKRAGLYRWVIKNNFPAGFRTLCAGHNKKAHIERMRQMRLERRKADEGRQHNCKIG